MLVPCILIDGQRSAHYLSKKSNNYILQFIIIGATLITCCDSGLPLFHIDQKTGIISWNIDRVCETRDLPLSMIAEESKVLVIPSVRFAPLVAADISEIFISARFMLLIPRYEVKTSPLLFNHNGDLITHCHPGDETYKVLNAVINDHDSTIIMLSEGLHW